jgi:hypothetical protein
MGEGWVGVVTAQLSFDGGVHPFRICEHIVVPET